MILEKLVQFYAEGWRAGHMVETRGDRVRIRPIGPYKASVRAVWIRAENVKDPNAKDPEEDKKMVPPAAIAIAPVQPKKTSDSTKKSTQYAATSKLKADDYRGQCLAVVKAILAFSTPKDLATITVKVVFETKPKGGAAESVKYHLRALVADGAVKEIKEA